MKLTAARLCLNCEEIHASKSCPRCASETFTYVTRWIPRIETAVEPPSIVVPTRIQRIIFGGGAISLIAYIAMRWWRRTHERIEVHSWRAAGDLR